MPPKTRPGSKTAGARPQNIQELAKIAGVSTATVSRALTGAGHLSTATRERIQKLAAELQFKPSMTARNLRIGRTGAIGVVVPLGHERTQHLSDPFFMTLISHVADRLADHGYDVLLSRVVPTDGNWLDRIAQSGRVDGIIVIGQSDQALVLDEAAKSYKPMVVWGSRIEAHREVMDPWIVPSAATTVLAGGWRRNTFWPKAVESWLSLAIPTCPRSRSA